MQFRLKDFESLEVRYVLTGTSFVPHNIAGEALETGCCPSVSVADLNGDGKLDIIVADYDATGEADALSWLDNSTSFHGANEIAAELLPVSVRALATADVEGDGDIDIFAYEGANSSSLLLFRNDGAGVFDVAEAVADDILTVATGDIDRDGDVDLLATQATAEMLDSGMGAQLLWIENDAVADKLVLHSTSLTVGGTTPLKMHDVDSDGDLDAIATGGHAVDLDSDGKFDEIITSVIWFANDGQGTFGQETLLVNTSCGGPNDLFFGDIDGDGDEDLLTAEQFLHSRCVNWYENVDGAFSSNSTALVDGTTSTHSADTAYLGDIDGDSDLDAVIDGSVFENLDGHGDFSGARSVAPSNRLEVEDIDGDGDLDLIAASVNGEFRGVIWFENRLTGDADNDGKVEFSDFLILAKNFGDTDAMFADGDFDMDGAVSFSDFLLLAQHFGEKRPE